MRTLLSLVIAFVASTSVLLLTQGGVAVASFHCMRIHAVEGGFNGNNSIQYVELRMDMGFQTLLTGHTLQFFDAGGTLKATFTFPTGVTNGNVGDSILLATAEFNSNVAGGTSDFTFSGANTTGANGGDPLHPVQIAGGSVVWAGSSFACATVMAPVDSVAYGGATATYGTAAVGLSAPATSQALRLSNLNIAPTNNATEYALTNVALTTFAVPPANLATDFSTPRNNGRTVLMQNAPPAIVRDHKTDANGDGYSVADESTVANCGVVSCSAINAFGTVETRTCKDAGRMCGTPNPPADDNGPARVAIPPADGYGCSVTLDIVPPLTTKKLAQSDIDLDGVVTILDLAKVATWFGNTINVSATDPRWEGDMDGDGHITILDLAAMASNFGRSVANNCKVE